MTTAKPQQAAKPTVVEALSAVMEDVRAVRKTDRNQQQQYNFRGIDAVVNAVGPILRKHGVLVLPTQTEAHYRDVQTSTGKPSRECTVNVTYRFYGPAGDSIPANVPGESMDFGDKGAPKAMSVAYRIVLLQALCIPTDEQDADSQTYERAASRQDTAGSAAPPPSGSRPGGLDVGKLYRDIGEAETTDQLDRYSANLAALPPAVQASVKERIDRRRAAIIEETVAGR